MRVQQQTRRSLVAVGKFMFVYARVDLGKIPVYIQYQKEI